MLLGSQSGVLSVGTYFRYVSSGIHAQIRSLFGSMESWVSKLGSMITRPEKSPSSGWLKLEKVLTNWQSLAEDTMKNFPSAQSVDESNKNQPNI